MRLDPADRIPCCVMGCRRTGARDKFPNCTEIICGKCYRAFVAKKTRERYTKIYRLIRNVSRLKDARRREPLLDACYRKAERIWQRIKREANERKFGI